MPGYLLLSPLRLHLPLCWWQASSPRVSLCGSGVFDSPHSSKPRDTCGPHFELTWEILESERRKGSCLSGYAIELVLASTEISG